MENWRALPVEGRLFESARWLEPEGCFQWVDILTAKVFRWDPGTDAVDSLDLGFDFLPLATPSQTPGSLLVASRDTLYTYRWGGEPTPLVQLPVPPGARLNDGIVDAFGRIWVGSMGLVPDPAKPLGSLWRIDPDGSVKEMLSGLGISNGIVWSGETAGFHVDSLARALYSVTHGDGGSLERELACEFVAPVEPDGIAMVDGKVWIALWDGAALGRYDPVTGTICETAVPAKRPSSLATSSELVLITTAGQGTGSNLDLSGQVMVSGTGSLRWDAQPNQVRAGQHR